MITVTAFKWVPPFAQGQVRDLRVRWALEELGLPYRSRLIDAEDQKSAAYRTEQPFGQVPVLEEDGVTMFESGAIVLDLAEREGGENALMPADAAARRQVRSWLFAALNTVEEPLGRIADLDFFERDEEVKTRSRPGAVAFATQRLGELQAALGDRDWLAGDRFTVADLMMSTVLRIVDHTDILPGLPRLAAYKARCEGRPAFRRALDAQCADFVGHSAGDMKWPQPPG